MMIIRNIFQYKVKLHLMVILLLLWPFVSAMALSATDNISISTDKSFYVVGELVNIKVINELDVQLINNKRDYVYCDLISQSGDIHLSQKLMLINGVGELQMHIPKNIKSGYYIIRAYTRQMRLSPLTYAFVEVRIVNIADSEVVGAGVSQSIELKKDASVSVGEQMIFEGLSSNYKRRDKVSFNINIDTSLYRNSSISVSVVPKLSTSINELKAYQLKTLEIDSSLSFDESCGFTLSGYITQKDTNNTVTGKIIYLSVRGCRDIYR